PPPKLPPSPMPKAILGVSFPSLGGAGTWAAARGTSAAGNKAAAPRTSIAVLRENFMIGLLLGELEPEYIPTGFSSNRLHSKLRRFTACYERSWGLAWRSSRPAQRSRRVRKARRHSRWLRSNPPRRRKSADFAWV